MCLGTIGRITEMWDEGGIPMARVRSGSAQQTACLLYVPDARVGDHILVHIGFAVEMLSDETAAAAVALRTGSKA